MGSTHIVPVIDIAPFLSGDPVGAQEVVRQIGRACETIGFLVITGYGISAELQERVFAVSREFFDLPEEEKLRYKVPRTYFGYNPVGSEYVAYSLGGKLRLTSRRIIRWDGSMSTDTTPTTAAHSGNGFFLRMHGRTDRPSSVL